MTRAILLLAILLAGCQSCTPAPTPVPPPQPVEDAGPPPAPSADAGAPEAAPPPREGGLCGIAPTCANACCHGSDLGCDWAKPTPGGTSCELVCQAYQDGPVATRWNLTACVAARTCGECR